MRFVIEDNRLILIREDVRFRGGSGKKVVAGPANSSSTQLSRVGEALVGWSAGIPFHSESAYLNALSSTFSFLKHRSPNWPSDDQWPTTILDFYCHYYGEGAVEAGRTVQSSRSSWSGIRSLLFRLMRDGVIPSCPVPAASLPARIPVSESAENLVIGEKYESVPPPGELEDLAWPKSFITDLSYTEDSETFFDDIARELSTPLAATHKICLEYWEEMLNTHDLSRSLINQISRAELLSALADPKWQEIQYGKKVHIADPRTERGVAFFLAAVNYYFLETNYLNELNWVSLQNIPFLAPITTSYSIQKILKAKIIVETENTLAGAQFPEILGRSLALFSTMDCSVAAAILIHEQPKFTPDALEDADLYDKNGKLLLSVSAASGGKYTFTVDKRRAHKRKGGMLTDLASDVIEKVWENNTKLRMKTDRSLPATSRKLFLVATRDGYGRVGPLKDGLNSKQRTNLYYLKKAEFEKAGISRETFNLSRIRNTQGILIWIKTTSVAAMASAMGNSIATVLSCYLPPWLLRRMHARIIRKFQQKTIVLATAGSDWQLAASDFETIDQLHAFIVQILTEDKYGNPFSDEFHHRFSKDFGSGNNDESGPLRNEDLYICLSPEAIASLEVFCTNYDSTNELDSHTESGLNPEYLLGIFQLISSAVHSSAESPIDEAIHDLLRGTSMAQLKFIWQKSRRLVEVYNSKIIADDAQ
ncbi:hypothetical protein ACYZT4_17365 [Pseudomonas sp. GB2N2]